MDEPFKSIDKENKIKIVTYIKNRFNKYNVTVIFVTHNEEEFLMLADKVIKLSGEPIEIIEEYYIDMKEYDNII